MRNHIHHARPHSELTLEIKIRHRLKAPPIAEDLIPSSPERNIIFTDKTPEHA